MHKLFLIGLIVSFSICLRAADDPVLQFITLGTAGGPESNAMRVQPANALVIGNNTWLVDAGDGAVTQLNRAGLRLAQVQGVLLSHLHFDHTGGMLAVLGLRAQMSINRPLIIYGPPGTAIFIDGLLAAMTPALQSGFGLPGQAWEAYPVVHEIRNDAVFEIDGVRVTTVENSHYLPGADPENQQGSVSLSYRFDTSERSIVYTGDTGPSDALTALAENADLLVIEMMDGPVVLGNIRRVNPGLNESILTGLERHFSLHHLTPEQVASLAAAASVKSVVVTHFMPGANSPEQAAHYRARMQPHYKGEIIFANDNDRY